MSVNSETARDQQIHGAYSPVSEKEPTLTPANLDSLYAHQHRPAHDLPKDFQRGLPDGINGGMRGGSNFGKHYQLNSNIGVSSGKDCFHIDDEDHGPGELVDSMSISKQTALSAVSDTTLLNKFADFFGTEIFQIVLHNPTTAHQLTKFSESRFCGENMSFLEKVQRYDELINELNKTMAEIHRSFLSVNAPTQLNLSQPMMKRVNSGIRKTITSNLPAMESIFAEAQGNIENLVATDIYPRFVRHQMTISAIKALATDKNKYGGLGDCFCLTNPAKADNPIVSASDGFVKVTGYTRQDIIPRNCRFLQGAHTDRVPVKRLKNAIKAREECVELLLNYKKNGEPFWNLLYVTPLFNTEGSVVFFLGGQINCSTTIHNCSDVLRVLSQSDDAEDEREDLLPQKNPSGKLGFFRSLKNPNRNGLLGNREVGMEQGLLNRIEKMNLRGQMSTFYTAYSKYMIMSYDDMVIRFYSQGITDMLNPSQLTSFPTVGSDIFKFLGHHATAVSRDYKQKVRTALKIGQAVSIDIHISTRRSAMFRGDEKFATHWTPLKDDQAKTTFIVLTMGSLVQPA